MNSRKVQDLKKEIEKINSILRDLGVVEGVVEKEVKSFGNGGHVILSKEHLNKKVKIII